MQYHERLSMAAPSYGGPSSIRSREGCMQKWQRPRYCYCCWWT